MSYEKGPLYWTPPNYIPSIYKAKAIGNTKIPGKDVIRISSIIDSMHKYTYLWLSNNAEFWSVPIEINENYIYVWCFNGYSWVYSEIPLRYISAFM